MSTAASPLYVHLGYAKTGTTYLQGEVFPRITAVRYRDKPVDLELFPQSVHAGYEYGVLDRAFKGTPAVWDEIGADVIASAVDSGASDLPVLVSDEGASVWFDPSTAAAHFHGLVAAAVRAGFGSVRIVCVVRRQDQRFGSAYAQVSDRRRGVGQADFEHHVETLVASNAPWPDGGSGMDYEAIRQAAVGAFGAGNVLFLPYEMMDADPETFYGRLLDMLGATDADRAAVTSAVADGGRANRRSTQADTWALRPLQPWLRVRLRPSRLARALRLPSHLTVRPWDPTRESTIAMTDRLRQTVLTRYDEGNRALAESLGIDLGRYGYFSNAD